MYLVRTIQKHERQDWVDQLGRGPEWRLPLPFVPRRKFDKVIVIHGDRALGFDLDRLEEIPFAEDAPVGTHDDPVIRARAFIYVRQGEPRLGRAKIRGFTGVRYVENWSDVSE